MFGLFKKKENAKVSLGSDSKDTGDSTRVSAMPGRTRTNVAFNTKGSKSKGAKGGGQSKRLIVPISLLAIIYLSWEYYEEDPEGLMVAWGLKEAKVAPPVVKKPPKKKVAPINEEKPAKKEEVVVDTPKKVEIVKDEQVAESINKSDEKSDEKSDKKVGIDLTSQIDEKPLEEPTGEIKDNPGTGEMEIVTSEAEVEEVANTEFKFPVEMPDTNEEPEEVKEIVKPVEAIDYDRFGRGLVYNCVNSHWACIDRTMYKLCEQYQNYEADKSLPRTCKVTGVFRSYEDCSKMQEYNINIVQNKSDLCQ